MPVLTLDYRHCDRKRPKFIKHVEIEAIAASARQQLVGSGVEAIAFDRLRQIERLKINDIDFALEVSTECEVHDEDGNHVFGICEYDPAVPDTAMVCVSPAGEKLSELLVPRRLLSAAAEELAPEYNVRVHRGPSLDPEFPGTSLHLAASDAVDMGLLERALAMRFDVNPRFVQMRLQRYGLTRPGAALR